MTLRPHSVAFLQRTDMRSRLEAMIADHSALCRGQVLYSPGREDAITVEACEPGRCIRTQDATDLTIHVDLMPPVDVASTSTTSTRESIGSFSLKAGQVVPPPTSSSKDDAETPAERRQRALAARYPDPADARGPDQA